MLWRFLICWILLILDGSRVFVMMDASTMFFFRACFFVVWCDFSCVLICVGGIPFFYILLIFKYISFDILLCFLLLFFFCRSASMLSLSLVMNLYISLFMLSRLSISRMNLEQWLLSMSPHFSIDFLS